MSIVKVSSKGQVVIPAPIRKKLNLKPKTKLEIHLDNEKIVAYPLPDDPIKALCGAVKFEKSVTQIMKETRAEEKRLEEKKFRRFLKK